VELRGLEPLAFWTQTSLMEVGEGSTGFELVIFSVALGDGGAEEAQQKRCVCRRPHGYGSLWYLRA
jgi:hypothetical protein